MPQDDNEYPRPTYAWYMLILLLIVFTISFIDRQILGLLGPEIKAEFGINDTMFGLLNGPAFAIFYIIFGLYFARLADRKSRKWLIAVGLFFWSIMTALSAFARNFATLFLCRIGVGVGEATLAPAANSILTDSFPRQKLATALSVYAMGIPIGSALAFYIGGSVIELASKLPEVTIPILGTISNWQKTLLIVGLPGILLSFIVIALREPSRKGTLQSGSSILVRDTVRFFKSRAKAYLGIYGAVSMTAAFGYGTQIFLALFFIRYHDLPPAEVGQTFGVIAIITGPAGLLIGGLIADRWYKAGQKDAYIKTLLIAPIGYAVPALLFPLAPDTASAWGLLAVANIFMNLPSGIAYASLQVITPNQMRGQITASYVLVVTLAGYSIGPLSLGIMTDYLFQDPMKLHYALVTLGAVTTPACIAFLLWGRKAYATALIEEETRLSEAAN